MSNLAQELLQNNTASQIGASASYLSRGVRVTDIGAERSRYEIYVGKVVAASGVSAEVQTSGGFNLWQSTKTGSISASTDTACTADAGTDTISATAHGLSSGDPICFSSSGNLPGGLYPLVVYYAEVVNANSFKVKETAEATSVINITSIGSGSHEVTKVRVIKISFNPEVAGDQAHLPLSAAVRVKVSTGAGDSCALVSVKAIQPG